MAVVNGSPLPSSMLARSSSSLAVPPALPLGPPLDLSILADDDAFESEAAWLNDILSPAPPAPSEGASAPPPDYSLSSLDSSLARTLALLDVATHDTSSLVDRTIDDISRSVPRLTFDLQLMRENALLLRFTLDGIRKRAASSGGPGLDDESPVAKVMEKLRVLDLVKARMEAARDVLREAESWSTLESEVTALVGEQAYGKAAERLEEAARSMVVFQNTTEYEARRALMVSLQNQLEASLSASLVAAINSRDVKACKMFFAIFGQIQREAEFTAYYFGSRRAALVESWTSVTLVDCPVERSDAAPTQVASSTKFSSFLVRFYSDLHSLLNEEHTYVPAIFPDPTPTLSAFIQTTLEGLSPSLPTRLSALADFHGPQVLPELIQAYRATEDFALMVGRIMAKLEIPDTPLSTPPIPSKKDRRLSKRMSISKRLGRSSVSFSGSGSGAALLSHLGVSSPSVEVPAFLDEPLPQWEIAIFEPFLDFQVEYPELERQYLADELSKATAGKNLIGYLSTGDGSERALWDLTVVLFGLAEDAVGRALALTHGYAAAGLVGVIDGQLAAFFDRRKAELVQAKKAGGDGTARPRTAGPEDDDEAALEGLEYSHEDWGAFQAGLRLLDTCRSISELLTGFEIKLRGRLTTLAQAVKDARSDPLRYTIPGTTRGAVTILRQSTLNSTELATLLSPLERSTDPPPSAAGSASFPFQMATPLPALLPRGRAATTELTKATQLFLHQTLLSPLMSHLSGYAALPVWSEAEHRPGGKGEFDLSIPTFSLSPTETISRVGEGLFNLPRLFEVYAANDALAFSLETLPFVDAESIYSPLAPAISPSTPRAGTHRMTSFTDSVDSGGPTSPSFSRRGQSTHALPPLSAETVITTWLSSLTLSILSHLTTSILPSIPKLTRHGSAQLVSDLWYISNVAKALDVETSEELMAWKDAVELDENGAKDESSVGDKAVFDRVARIRGWRR